MADDLLHHYKVLKQFLDISNDAGTTRKNSSSRAAKARDKLLKLSAAQFKELSTDVYDELRRRIDELRSEPDFLLPKLNFHPKRNQARQKLSSLPQSRFRDLVSDISYEIERRQLHGPSNVNNSIGGTNAAIGGANIPNSGANNSTGGTSNAIGSNSGSLNASGAEKGLKIDTDPFHLQLSSSYSSKNGAVDGRHRLSVQSSSSYGHHLNKNSEALPTSPLVTPISRQVDYPQDHNESAKSAELYGDLATPDLRDVPKQAMALLSTTVIPTKANMTWSSDEEDEPYNHERAPHTQEHRPNVQDHAPQTQDRESYESQSSQNIHTPAAETARRILLSDTFAMDRNKAPPRIASLGSPEPAASRIDDIEVLRERYTVLELENSELKAKIEEFSFKLEDYEHDKKSYLHEKESLITRAEYSDLQDELDTLRSSNAALRLENQNIKTKMRRDSKASSRDLSNISHVSASDASASIPMLAGTTVAAAASSLASGMSYQSLSQPSGSSRALESEAPAPTVSVTPSAPVDVNTELRKFYEKLDQISVKPANTQTTLKEELLRNEALLWQKKFESSQAKQRVASFKLPNADVYSYTSPTGLVPLKRAIKFFTLVETFIESVSSTHADTDLLFEKISLIALAANKICGEPSLQNSTQADAIRGAASHALTATRYYATYSNLMPRVIVERAVSEIAFSVCDFISVCKLRVDENQPINESSFMNQNDTTIEGVRPLKISSKSIVSELAPQGFEKRDILPAHTRKVSETIPTESASTSTPTSTPLAGKVTNNLSALGARGVGGVGNAGNTGGSGGAGVSSNKSATTSPSTKDVDGKENIYDTHGLPLITKPSILEKVKHFEQKELESQNAKRSSYSPSLSNKSRFSDEFTELKSLESKIVESANDKKLADEPKPIDGVPTRNKSIFQSLRERFTGEPQKGSTESKEESFTKEPEEAAKVPGSEITESISEQEKPMVALKNTVSFEPSTNEEALLSKPGLGIEIPASKTAKSATTATIGALGAMGVGVAGASAKGATNSNSSIGSSTNNEHTVTTSLPKEVNEASKKEAVDTQKVIAPKKTTDLSELVKEAVKEADKIEVPNMFQKSAPAEAKAPEVTRPNKVEPNSKEFMPNDVSTPKETETKQVEAKLLEAKPKNAEPKAVEQKGVPKAEVKESISKTSNSTHGPTLEKPTASFNTTQNGVDGDEEESEYDEEEDEARQRQDYRKSMAAATFNFDLFDIDDPDNTLTQLLLYLEHQTVQVISTIQDLLSAIKKPDVSRGELRENSGAISEVIRQMTEATNTSMNQTRNHQLKEHGSWVVRSLEDCDHRMNALCKPTEEKSDSEFADRHFKQRLAGISFDIAKCTKELVKTVEEASLKEDIAQLDARINQVDLR